MKTQALFVGLCIALSCCATNPSSPTTTGTSFAGTWSGLTSQGASIVFTVSADEKITSISIGYTFGSCSAVKMLANLNVDLLHPPVNVVPSARLINFDSGAPERILISGQFVGVSGEGTAVLSDFPGCGGGSIVSIAWTASKK